MKAYIKQRRAREDLLLSEVEKELGKAPELQAIIAYFEKNGRPEAKATCRRLYAILQERLNASYEQFFEVLSKQKLPRNPTVKMILFEGKKNGLDLPYNRARSMHNRLRENMEKLDERSYSKKQARLNKVDSELYARIERMFYPETRSFAPSLMPLLIRCFVLACSKYNVNVVDLVRDAQLFTPEDMEIHARVLEGLSFLDPTTTPRRHQQ